MSLGPDYVVRVVLLLVVCTLDIDIIKAFEVTASEYAISDSPTTFLLRTNFTLQSGIQCLWDFGDGKEVNLSRMDLESPIIHIYNKSGHYTVEVSCNDTNGWPNKSIPIEVQQPIENLTAKTQDSFVATNVTFNLTIGIDAGDPLSLNTSAGRDNQQIWEYFLGDNLTALDGFAVTVPLTLSETGLYTLITNGWNDVSSQIYRWDIAVQNKLLGLAVDTPAPVPYVGEPAIVNVTFVLEPLVPPPTGLSLEFILGDGQRIVIPHWGEDQVEYAALSTIEVIYTEAGIYSATLNLYNGVSDQSASFPVRILDNITATSQPEAEVSLRPCDIPLLRMNSHNFTSAPSFFKNRAITLSPDVTIDCDGSGVNTYRWRAYKVDEASPYPSIDNEVLFGENVRTDSLEFTIPPFTLAYGEHIVAVTVFLNGDDSVGTTEHNQHYIQVIPSILVPRITGGSLRTISWYSEVVLNGSSSYDPDLPSSDIQDSDLIFRWYCRMANETFPPAMNGSQCSTCGCFGSGFHVSGESSPATTVSSSLVIPEEVLEGNVTYIFRLEISKPGRDSAATEQTITVLADDVIEVSIRCIINCDMYMNPSERLVLSGKCQDCPQSASLRYEWTVTPYTDDVTGLGIIDWSKDTTTGRSNAYLVIKGGVFSRFNIPEYNLKLTMHSSTSTPSHAELSIKINFPPSRGMCFVAPTEGFVLFTYFYISCSMFFDVDTPLGYQIRVLSDHSATGAHLEDYSQGSLIFFGLDPLFPPTFLPLGLPANDYRVSIAIIATDAFGASVVTHLNATVRPPLQAYEEVFDKVVNLTQGEDSEMTHLLESHDTQGATLLVTTVSSILNSETVKQRQEGREEGTKKEARIHVRDQLISNLDRVEIHDLESLQLTSTAIAEVTKEEEEVSTTSQLSASSIYHRMGSLLQEQSGTGATTVTIEGSARQLVTGVAHIMGASSKQLRNISAPTTNNVHGNGGPDDSTAENGRNISLTSVDTLKKIETAILHNKVPGEEAFIIKTEEVEVILNRLEKWEIDSKLFEVPGKDAFIKLPSSFGEALHRQNSSDSGYDAILDTHVRHFTNNPYTWSGGSEVTSQVIAIDVVEGEGEALNVTDLLEPVNIFLDNNIDERTVTLLGELDEDSGRKLFGFNITEGVTHIMLHFKIENYFNGDNATNIDVTVVDGRNTTEALTWFEFSLPWETVPYVETSETTNITGDPYSVLLERDMLYEEGSYYMNIQVGGKYNWTSEWSLTILVYSPRCVYWDERLEEWESDGCQPGPLTNLRHTHCICDHLSTFAGGFLPLPNAIHFRDDIRLFSELFENPVTAITVTCILLVFTLVAVWARRKDLKEDEVELIILADNDPDASYQYHVAVITGMRRSSGTSSTATITLQGRDGSSDPHVLTAPHRPVLQRSSRDSFLVTTNMSLGELTGVRIWHDNSGSSPDWYISRVIIHDLQNNRWWYFLCQSWLGLGFGENCIDQTFPAATKEDLTEFHHLFLSAMQRDLHEYHLWLSVMVRPPHSTFTRLQRAACCLCITLTAMLVSIIFFGVPEEYSTKDSNISVGSLSLSWSSIIIGIESSLVTVPVNYVICMLFRDARSREQDVIPSLFGSSDFTSSTLTFRTASLLSSVKSNSIMSGGRQILHNAANLIWRTVHGGGEDKISISERKETPEGGSDVDIYEGLSDGPPNLTFRRERHKHWAPHQVSPGHRSGAVDDSNDCQKADRFCLPGDRARSESDPSVYGTPASSIEELVCQWSEGDDCTDVTEACSTPKKYEEFQGRLPWWSIYIAWALVFITCLACSFFIILYGLRYGKQQSLDWLVSMIVSLVQSIGITQPINVVFLAALFALVLPTHTHDTVGLRTSKVVDARAEILSGGNIDIPLHKLRNTHFYQPPTTRRIEKAREKRLKKAQLVSVLKSFVGQVFFIFLVLEMAYMGRDPNTYLMKQALTNSFIGNARMVRTSEDLLGWMRDVYVPALYGGSQDGFILEDFAFRVGASRMRQLRIKKGSCKTHSMVASSSSCEDELDTGRYNASWVTASGDGHTGSAWEYQTGRVVQGSHTNEPVSHLNSEKAHSERGGYVLNLGTSRNSTDSQLGYIELHHWLNDRTRAVFVEWNMFNPNTNLLCACCMLFERFPSGEFRASPEFDIMKPVDYRTVYDKVSLCLEGLYLTVIVVLILIEVRRYWKDPSNYWGFWNALTILIIILSIAASVFYSYSLLTLYVALKCYRMDHERYCSFFRAALLTRAFNYLIAAIVFFASIKCAKLMRYNKSIHLMQMTWYVLASKFKMSVVAILIIFTGFAILAHLLFGTSVYYFDTLVSSFQTLFVMVSGNFDQLPEITQTYGLVSILFVILTMFILLYVFMNLMIVFIIESFVEAQTRCETEVDHRDVVSSFIGWMSSYFGVNRMNTKFLIEEEEEGEVMEEDIEMEEGSDVTKL